MSEGRDNGDEVSCSCPRCWPALHVDDCGDVDCAGQCREESGVRVVVEPLSEEERAEMVDLARSRWDLLPTAYRERLEELRRRDIDAHDDRVPVSIEFPPDEGS